MLLPCRNKVPGWIKQGGGLDSAHGFVFATSVLSYSSLALKSSLLSGNVRYVKKEL